MNIGKLPSKQIGEPPPPALVESWPTSKAGAACFDALPRRTASLSPPCKGGVWGGGQGATEYFHDERRGGGQGATEYFHDERRGGGQGATEYFHDERRGGGQGATEYFHDERRGGGQRSSNCLVRVLPFPPLQRGGLGGWSGSNRLPPLRGAVRSLGDRVRNDRVVSDDPNIHRGGPTPRKCSAGQVIGFAGSTPPNPPFARGGKGRATAQELWPEAYATLHSSSIDPRKCPTHAKS
jgi:hypothetical protein